MDCALEEFSSYIAADELYDGAFCVLSIVDHHLFNRLIYQLLDHAPEHEDIEAFLLWFKATLQEHGLGLQGVTTDGTPFYQEPLKAVVGVLPHQSFQFYIIKESTKAILRAVVKVRKKLTEQKPKLKRGRPSTKMTKRAVLKGQRLQQKIADLIDYHYLFVQHDLTPAQLKSLQQITRSLPQMCSLRSIMKEIYRLFDCRCRTNTALAKLTKLRQRGHRFKQVGKILSKFQSPNLDKAQTFLEDKLLPSTSNAVGRSNRRHRKMQKTFYRGSYPREFQQQYCSGYAARFPKGVPNRNYRSFPLHQSGV